MDKFEDKPREAFQRYVGNFCEWPLLDTTEKLVQLDAEGSRQSRESLQTGLFPAEFEIGDVVLVDACLLRKVELAPASRLPQLANFLPEQDTNITCHPYYRRVRLISPSLLS
jgi:hypothetical protein